MTVPAPRIALIGLHLESNSFAPPSGEADFRSLCLLEGLEILKAAALPASPLPAEMTAFIHDWTRRGAWQPVPILVAAAEPGGPIDQHFFANLLMKIETALRQAGPIDGVYLSNHGGMTATEEHDPDGHLYALVRDAVGPNVPVIATVDLHANISDRMVASADLIIGYRTNPHIDQIERGREAAARMADMLAGQRYHTAFRRLPLVAPSVSLLTANGPYADAMASADALCQGSIVNISPVAGFVFSDTPKNGIAVLVAGSDADTAERAADQLATQIWRDRGRFVARLTDLPQAVAAAERTGRQADAPRLILADVADNPGGGGRGNTTFILEALLQAGVQGAVLGIFHDPALAEEAHQRGLGKRFNATFNRSGHIGFTRRFQTEARVVGLSDGRCVGTRGLYQGRALDHGLSAALDLGGVVVVVVSRRKQCADPVQFTMVGVDPSAARTIMVKSRGHFRAGFDLLAAPEQILEVDVPGLTSPILTNFKFRHLPRPIWPLDSDTQWSV